MPSSPFKPTVLKFLTVIALLALTWWVGKACFTNEAAVRAFLGRFPVGLAALLFVAFYIGASFFILDVKGILRIVGAMMFGMWWSTLLVWVAEMVNNAVLFHLSRRLGRAWLYRKFRLEGQDIGWVARLCGVWQIFALRILPVFSYRFLDLAYGLTTVQFRRYFIVSAVASPIRIFWVQSLLVLVGAAVYDPWQVYEFICAHPETIRVSVIYLVVSVGAAFALRRKFK